MTPLNIVRPIHPPLKEWWPYLDEALSSGAVTNDGKWVKRFEAELSAYLGKPTIVFNNGQTALMTMLLAANIKHGNVVTPSLTFCATPHAIRMCGSYPVFAEVNDNLVLDWDDVGKKVTKATKAILAVDAYGIISCGNREFYGKDGRMIPIYSDSAPSFGSEPRTHAFANIFSFHATKPFSTMEGGALSSHNPDFLDLCRRIRNFGQNADGDCETIGLNGKMMEVCAIMGLKQLETWRKMADDRRIAADALEANLEGIPGIKVIKAPEGQRPIWLYRPILVTEDFGMSRDSVMSGLKTYDIHTRKYYTACHQLSVYRHMGLSLPKTEKIASQVISLPVYSDMKMDEIGRIGMALRELQSAGGY